MANKFIFRSLLIWILVQIVYWDIWDVVVCPNVNFKYKSEGKKDYIIIPKSKKTGGYGHEITLKESTLDYRDILTHSVVVNIKKYAVSDGQTLNVLTIIGQNSTIVNSQHLLSSKFMVEYKKDIILSQMGYSHQDGKYTRIATFIDNDFFMKVLYQTGHSTARYMTKSLERLNNTVTFDQYTFSVRADTDLAAFHEYIFTIKPSIEADEYQFEIPQHNRLRYWNGMLYNEKVNIEKNLYAPTVASYTRKILNPGFHKMNDNVIKLERFMNPEWQFKILEIVPPSIFIDKDEINRFHDLEIQFDHSIDIEKPSNASQAHLVSYVISVDEHNGTISKANVSDKAEWMLFWNYPLHLRYGF